MRKSTAIIIFLVIALFSAMAVIMNLNLIQVLGYAGGVFAIVLGVSIATRLLGVAAEAVIARFRD